MTPAELGKASLPASDRLTFDGLRARATRASGRAAWYDAFPLSKARFVVTIGTVAAGEREASALMGRLRAIFSPRAAALSCSTLLGLADTVLRLPVWAGGTALVGIVDCVDQSFTYLSSGHPPPHVRYGDGRVVALPALGVPPGQAPSDVPSGQVEVDLGGAELLVLSAGSFANTGGDGADATRRLMHILGDERMEKRSGPAAWIAARMFDELAPDGAALLTLAFPTGRTAPGARAGERPNWKVAWSFDSTAAAANSARRAFLACLGSKAGGGKAIDLAASELIFGELLGNVVRHAPGPVDITLDWTADMPVLHVLDSGPGFRSRRNRERLPVDDWSECGRGLFIVNACAAQFSVRNRNGRGTHATVTLPAA